MKNYLLIFFITFSFSYKSFSQAEKNANRNFTKGAQGDIIRKKDKSKIKRAKRMSKEGLKIKEPKKKKKKENKTRKTKVKGNKDLSVELSPKIKLGEGVKRQSKNTRKSMKRNKEKSNLFRKNQNKRSVY